MGGELKLKSEYGRGSEFYFTITLPKGEFSGKDKPEPGNDGDSGTLEGVRILMAEDNVLNAEIALELLEHQGASVTWAQNGRSALEQFMKSEPGTYRILLMDLMMPEMNGLEAVKSIRALPREDAKTVPILAMSANSFKEDEENALAVGMNGFISKPIDVENLYRQLYLALKSGEGGHSADRRTRGKLE